MVPTPTRRQVLTVGGTAAAALAGGYAFAERTTGDPDTLEGWPMSRGNPAGTGYAPDATPPRDGVTVAWKQSFEGRLGFGYHPSPVVADGQVYAVGEELVALNTDTGDIEFRTRTNGQTAPAIAPVRAYNSPTLVVGDNGDAMGLHADGGFTVLGSAVGRERWRLSATGGGTLSFGSSDPGPPPVVADGLVLLRRGDAVVAVTASDGTIEWEQTAESMRPVVSEGRVYLNRDFSGILVCDLQTGERLDTIETDDGWVAAAAAGPDGVVINTYGKVLRVTGETVDWRYTSGADNPNTHAGAVAVDDGAVYTGIRDEERDWLVALDLKDGAELWRSKAAPEPSPAYTPPAVANDTVYIPVEDGGIAAIDSEEGRVRWRFEGDGQEALPMSPVAIVDDRLYVADSSYVYALEES